MFVDAVLTLDAGSSQKHNASQIRTDDYSVIGAALGALLVPAVFLRSGRLPSLILGGACVGLGAGVWVHLGRMFTEGGDVRPEGMVSLSGLDSAPPLLLRISSMVYESLEVHNGEEYETWQGISSTPCCILDGMQSV